MRAYGLAAVQLSLCPRPTSQAPSRGGATARTHPWPYPHTRPGTVSVAADGGPPIPRCSPPGSGAMHLGLSSHGSPHPRGSDRPATSSERPRLGMRDRLGAPGQLPLPFAGGVETHVEQIASRLAAQGDDGDGARATRRMTRRWPSSGDDRRRPGPSGSRCPSPVGTSPSHRRLGGRCEGAARELGRRACPRVPQRCCRCWPPLSGA